MAWFDIVVANGLCVVLHIIDDRSCEILILRHHVIRPVDARLALKDVTIINQQEVVAILLSLLADVSVRSYKCTFNRLLFHEVVWKEMPVYITGLNDFQTYGLRSWLGISVQ